MASDSKTVGVVTVGHHSGTSPSSSSRSANHPYHIPGEKSKHSARATAPINCNEIETWHIPRPPYSSCSTAILRRAAVLCILPLLEILLPPTSNVHPVSCLEPTHPPSSMQHNPDVATSSTIRQFADSSFSAHGDLRPQTLNIATLTNQHTILQWL
ncbi:hypothetical protein O988_02658 [Pseudogymnoascus sp. VKM F-3808]|nr:hypothetical protein O988_02658 [Pseudogymnoascus sp. VKM F-3808]